MENSHSEEIASLFSSKEYLYPVWYLQLTQGFHVMLHGYGSKKIILRKFCESLIVIETFRVFFIDGSSLALTLENILIKLHQEYIAGYDGSFKTFKKLTSLYEKSKYVTSSLEHLMNQSQDPSIEFIDGRPKPILFAISNIDGSDLSSPIRTLEIRNFIYSLLNKVEQFRLISTMDHINGPLLLDPAMVSGARMLFYDISTFLNYQEEIKHCDFSIPQGKRILSGSHHQNHILVITVLNNLSVNARKIYLLFLHVQYKWVCINVEHSSTNNISQAVTKSASKGDSTKDSLEDSLSSKINTFSLSNLENSPSVNNLALKLISSPSSSTSSSLPTKTFDYLQFPGISFSQFVNLAIENFLASNDVAFKTIIQEFTDHKILVSKKSDEGVDIYYIPFKLETLILISKELKTNY